MTQIAWPDERVDLLKRLWAAGLSASQCAAELNGPEFAAYSHISRNSAIGKVHRLGLSGRLKKIGATPALPRKPRPTYVRPKQFKAPPLAIGNTALAAAYEADSEISTSDYDNVIPMTQRVTLLGLNEETCRWPIGDVQQAGFAFCGAKPWDSAPYCAHHCRIAYQPASERRRGYRRGGRDDV